MARREENQPQTYGIPIRVFLFTLDQISVMLNVSVQSIRSTYIHFDGRSTGAPLKDRMLARNIAPADEKPDWRVAEREFVRFMKYRGFKVYDRGWIDK